MLLSGLYDNDISPIPPFSPFFFDTNEVDFHFFQDHPHLLVAQHPPLSRDTSSETIAESEVDNNMEVFNTTNMSKDGDNCSGEKDGSSGSNVQRNKKSSISTRKNPKKRPFTKDRHSKIVTAQGPRDRRMRLSLDIARRFFMVQDMLGFDKASKTVEWLMVQSKGAIKELSAGVSQSNCTGSVKSVSSTSECEVVSGYDEMATDEYLQQVNISGENPSSGISKEKRTKKSRKAAVNPLAKESRKIARARAKQRTIEKMWSRSQQCPQVTPHGLRKLNPSNSLKLGENILPDPQSQDLNSSSVDAVDQVEAPSSHSLDCQGSIQDIVGDSFAITNKSSSSSIFDYHHDMDISQGLASTNNFSNFSANWEIDSSATASVINMTSSLSQNTADSTMQHQFADIHFYMPWDSYRR